MKQDIERIFQEALKNQEFPYQEGAWEQFSKRLDGTPPSPFYRKWWFAAAMGTVLVGSATYFALKETGITDKQTVVASENSSTTIEQLSGAETSEVNQEVTRTPITPSKTPSNELVISGEASPELEALKSIANHENTSPLSIEPEVNHGNKVVKPDPTSSQINYLPLALKSHVCLHEELEIHNPNAKASILAILPKGKTVEIEAGTTAKVTAVSEGSIQVISGKHMDLVTVVKPTNRLYTDVDPSLLYENGIPTLKFTISGNENPVSWISNVKGTELKQESFVVHPYKEKQVIVTALSKDQNGCKIEDVRTIQIKEEYNLLAPTGFTPLDYDSRTNRFMPFALTQRETAFDLMIYDSKNGGILFQSNEATNGWDGIDKRSGELVPIGSIWVWKVILKNPNTGEPREYSGTITRM